jgi:hypothetical protein
VRLVADLENEMLPVQSSMPASWRMSRRVGALLDSIDTSTLVGGSNSSTSFATDALLGLAFSHAISSFRSFAGIVFFAQRRNGAVHSGEIGIKSFKT